MKIPKSPLHLMRWGTIPILLFTLAGLVTAAPVPDRAGRTSQVLPTPHPKLTLSSKQARPEIAYSGGVVTYTITVRNTGAAPAPATNMHDPFPANTTYNGDAWASAGEIITGTSGLTWTGEVGFDTSVIITFSVTTDPAYTGRITNTAVISQPEILAPITVTAVCTATDHPILDLAKEGTPLLPGAGKPLTYTLWLGNNGQPAQSLPITVTDRVPSHTTLLAVGPGAITDTMGHITWTRAVTLDLGARTSFTFSVLVDEGVPSGTVILNEGYAVTSSLPGVGAVGDPYTLTVVTPILRLTKQTDPDPPGSNRSMVYTLTLRNLGSPASGIVVTDTVPDNVTYLSGGTYLSATNTVSWTHPSLAPMEKAVFTYSVFVGNLPEGTLIVNDSYGVHCGEGIAAPGRPLTSTVAGPSFFNSWKKVVPIAMKPGGGASILTYTIGIHNSGEGNALDVYMRDEFTRVSFSAAQVTVNPPIGHITFTRVGNMRIVEWLGDVAHDSQVTFTIGPCSNIFGGVEIVTNTAWISDDLTLPVSATTRILVTKHARLNVYKSGPAVIGPKETMTYTLAVVNSAFATSPTVWLTDVLPIETTFVTASHGGTYISSTGMVSWTLPDIATGGDLTRSLTVEVGDWPSGTLIVNRDFRAGCANCVMTDTVFEPVTTTVQIRGLGDSYKEVHPALAYPGPAVVLTYTLHIVNSSRFQLDGVQMNDYLPWVQSTYNRDAIASAGSLISDIVHLEWTGDMGPDSEVTVTMSVLADPWYKGPVTNTAVIDHPSLNEPVTVTAVAYVTDEPVLRLSKRATPDPVRLGSELLYTLRLRNLGQMATELVISDTIPEDTSYVPGSATRGGTLVGDAVYWEWPELEAGTAETFAFRVVVEDGPVVRNENYLAFCEEGIRAYGEPVETRVIGGRIYLPLILKNGP